MKERSPRKELPVEFFLAVREYLGNHRAIPDDLLMTKEEIITYPGPLGQTFSPLDPRYVIHPGTGELIEIPEGSSCQRNFDGTAVHIDPYGEPVYFKSEEEKH